MKVKWKFEIPVIALDWAFWISWSVVFVWIILKMFGIINTSLWQLWLPAVGAMIGFATVFMKAGSFYQMIKTMGRDMLKLDRRMENVEDNLTEVKVEFKGVSKDLHNHIAKLHH